MALVVVEGFAVDANVVDKGDAAFEGEPYENTVNVPLKDCT